VLSVKRQVHECSQRRWIWILLGYLVSYVLSEFQFTDIICQSGWDIHDTPYSKELLISNKDNGYRDIIAKVDLSTYRRLPWEYGVPFFLVSFLDPETKEPICACPRGTVAKALKAADKHDWDCIAGVEYEASTVDSVVT
jgi:glutamine synthetase